MVTTTTIIGGGIAATALAAALAAAGRPAVAYERNPALHGGAFLVLDGRGHAALGNLGISAEALHAASKPVTALRIESTNGPVRERLSDEHRLYRRSDLMGVLQAAAAKAGADIRYEQGVSELVVDRHTTTFRVGDQLITTDGLVVGADGIDSPTRAAVDPGRDPVYADQVVLYGMTTKPVTVATAPAVLHFHNQAADDEQGLASNTFGHIWHENSDALLWFARLTRPALAPEKTGANPIANWADILRTATPAVPDLVDTAVDHTDTVYVSNARNVPFVDAPQPRESIVLVGDADHALTPAGGVGARDAVEDVDAIYQAMTTGNSVASAMTSRRAAIAEERDRIAQAYAKMRS